MLINYERWWFTADFVGFNSALTDHNWDFWEMESTYLSNMVGWEILNKHGELNESNIELHFMMFSVFPLPRAIPGG